MPKKIFELAKELDMNSLELVEVLRDKGYAVRNHMTALTEEEVAKVMAMYQPTPAQPAKATKKAVVKKSSKQKVVKRISKAEIDAGQEPQISAFEQSFMPESEAEVEQAQSTQDVEGKPKTAVRKKAAILKKSDDSGEVGLESTLPTQENISAKDAKTGGLRVVAMPKVPEVVETKAPHDETGDVAGGEATESKKDYFQEKVHRFTPVFIPEQTTADAKGSDDQSGDAAARKEPGKESEEDEKSSKKRLGGLASMMSGKKIVVSRSQAIKEERADSELKSYMTLSSLGKPIYSTLKRKKNYMGPSERTMLTETKDSKRVIFIHDAIKATDLASKLSLKFQEFADQALNINILLRSDDYLGVGLAQELAAQWNYRIENRAFDEAALLEEETAVADTSHLPFRSPVVTIMGHVDHGKTTLLDGIRKAKVADGEAGGITQHIGAYSVNVRNKTITFLDTPGHAAFANMRQRGANVTDIVILVVAADDGVMPQTKESIRFCKNANVPIIVAVNKCDKEGVNPDKIKQELGEFNITPEEWGGDTQFVNISALKGTGIDELLDSILIQAEVMDLRANEKGAAKGVVIESKIEVGRGPVATILVQEGMLKKGDYLVVGECWGRARSLMDHTGAQLKEAGPSTPVQIIGLDVPPSPGDSLYAVKNEREAKKIVENRISQRKELESVPEKKKMSLEDFFAEAPPEGEMKSLNLIIRTDVQGSFEAIKQSLEALGNSEVSVKVIGGGVGAITDSDVMSGANSGAYIIGFNMRPVTSARKLAEEKGVDVKTYSIIYELINDVTLALEGLLAPEFIEEFTGRAEVRNTFAVPKIGVIAGCFVVDGKIKIGCKIRLLRSGKIVYDGKLSSLKRFKDDVKEVKNGLECGMGLENFNDIKVGDIFEAYMMVEKKRKLEDVAKTAELNAKKAEETSVELS